MEGLKKPLWNAMFFFFFVQIKWLLKDEIASARRHIFPVTASTLDMVADHVCNSLGKKTCLHQQVDLKFVFGPEQSLSEFIKVNLITFQTFVLEAGLIP